MMVDVVPDRFDNMADEADRYADMLAEMGEPDLRLMAEALSNIYDVIVSEALDYVIRFGVVDQMKAELLRLSSDEPSYLVSGRLRLCGALSEDGELRAVLAGSTCREDDTYCQVWESAVRILESGDQRESARLDLFAHDPDRTIASLAHSLQGFLRSK